jgi:hypothetical protein
MTVTEIDRTIDGVASVLFPEVSSLLIGLFDLDRATRDLDLRRA